MMEVRPIEAGDRESVAEIIELATAELRRVYRPVPNRARAAGPHGGALSSLVAVDGTAVIGVVDYYAGSDSLCLQGLAVHPARRREGVARALVRAAQSLAVRERIPSLTADTIKETGNARLFVELGFRVLEELPADGFESPSGGRVTRVRLQRTLV